jgi:hypothetical protein
MHDASEILILLQIADLAKEWPELRPLHDRAMEKLREIAKQPGHKANGPKDGPKIEERTAVSPRPMPARGG